MTAWYLLWFLVGFYYQGFAASLFMLSLVGAFPGKQFDAARSAARVVAIPFAVGAILLGTAYILEATIALREGEAIESWVFMNRAFGPSGWAYWLTLAGGCLFPQLLWIPFLRRRPWITLMVSAGATAALLMESFVAMMTFQRDQMPAPWGHF